MHICVLAGGVGGARFLRGVREACAGSEISAIVNTGDDITLHGLRVCPDLDSVMYTLAGIHDTDRGWGRKGETWRIKDELAAYGADASWFGLGDLDVATHLVRTQMLDAGYPLSEVTAALCTRWDLGITLLPMTDQRCETHVVVEVPDSDPAHPEPRRQALHFQQWWVEHRASLPAQAFVQVGLDEAKAAPAALDALAAADVVLVAPSNPVVSIDTILAVPGFREALHDAPAKIVGLSPIVGGAPVRGMADACLPAVGVEVSAAGVARHYGARKEGGLLDGWLVDERDREECDERHVPGVAVRAVPLMMTDDAATAAMVRAALEVADAT